MGLSSLNNSTASLVGDTSAVINLNATGCASAILQALPNGFVITDVVLDELREDIRSGRNDADMVARLMDDGLVQVVGVDTLKGGDFERLVSGGSSTTLDDGEAATIAYAFEKGMVAILDERKANQICRTRYPAMLAGCTIDLLSHPNVATAHGKMFVADAVYKALTGARMRVLPQHLDWAIDLIGPDRARQCVSLPKRVRSSS